MGDAIEGMKAVNELRKQENRDRRMQAVKNYHAAAQVAVDNGLVLINYDHVHFQLRGPGETGWIIDLYPSNQRICHDKNRPKPPFLELPEDRDWTLMDVVRAAAGNPEPTVPEELRSGTWYDAVSPMRHLHAAIKIVEQLNEIGDEKLGCGQAHLVATGTYLAIHWGETILWDSEGVYREDREFDDEEDWEPTLDLCRRILADEGRKLAMAFRDHQQVTDAGVWNVEAVKEVDGSRMKVVRWRLTDVGLLVKELLSTSGQWVAVSEGEAAPEECLTLAVVQR